MIYDSHQVGGVTYFTQVRDPVLEDLQAKLDQAHADQKAHIRSLAVRDGHDPDLFAAAVALAEHNPAAFARLQKSAAAGKIDLSEWTQALLSLQKGDDDG